MAVIVMIFRRRRPQTPEISSADLAREVLALAPILDRYRGAPPTFGSPTRCPSCSSFGMVVQIVPGPVVASENECPSCRTRWTITRRALGTVRRAGSIRAALADLGHEEPQALVPDLAAEISLRQSRGELPPEVLEHPPVLVPTGPLSLLLVEDDPADAALLEAILEPVGDEVSMRRAWSRTEGEKLAGNPDIDLVLLDLGLPDSSGLTTLHRWTPKRQVPLMILSGNDNGGLEDASYRYGVGGFMHKQGLFDILESGEDGTQKMVDLFRETVGAVAAPAGSAPIPRVPSRGTWAN